MPSVCNWSLISSIFSHEQKVVKVCSITLLFVFFCLFIYHYIEKAKMFYLRYILWKLIQNKAKFYNKCNIRAYCKHSFLHIFKCYNLIMTLDVVIGMRLLRGTCLHRLTPSLGHHGLSSPAPSAHHDQQQEVNQLIPYRNQSTEAAQPVPSKPPPGNPAAYSPFNRSPNNKAEYALARVDDLMNWVRKVGTSWCTDVGGLPL